MNEWKEYILRRGIALKMWWRMQSNHHPPIPYFPIMFYILLGHKECPQVGNKSTKNGSKMFYRSIFWRQCCPMPTFSPNSKGNVAFLNNKNNIGNKIIIIRESFHLITLLCHSFCRLYYRMEASAKEYSFKCYLLGVQSFLMICFIG
jgi:hypothetical protein